ncbi:MAG: glycoside hydrolase [Bacteroidales bacterium]|nr:glycoside hydrolase [Bacteroidales bacterium]
MKAIKTAAFFLIIGVRCFAQDFWMQLEVPEDTGVYCVKGNSTGETFLGARGLHKSIDHGLNWLPTGFTELTGTIDINLANGDIYVGNHLGVFYSTDNVETWHATTFYDNANIIFFSTNNNVFVGNWGRIYKSTDLGQTWEQVLELDNTPAKLIFTLRGSKNNR